MSKKKITLFAVGGLGSLLVGLVLPARLPHAALRNEICGPRSRVL
jgi:hypothetical protein